MNSPQTARAFITWAVSDRDLVGQFLELAFQMIFAGVIGIRHGGSEESINAVRRQSSKWLCNGQFHSQCACFGCGCAQRQLRSPKVFAAVDDPSAM